jgi:hypothetical protein
MILQEQLDGFAASDHIKYYTPSRKKMKHLHNIYEQYGMLPSTVPENEAYWYKPKVATRNLHRIPYTDLRENKRYIEVIRGERDFTEKKIVVKYQVCL